MPSLDELEETLAQAARLLDEAARQIRDLDLNPKANVRKMGEAIVLASEIRYQIYELRPDLKPDFLKS